MEGEKQKKATEDLWPSLIDTRQPRVPAAILSEQAALLPQKTNAVLAGEVKPSSGRTESNRLAFVFNIVAPLLNNYRLRLIGIAHGVVALYPVRVAAFLMPGEDEESVKIFEARDEKQFINIIKEILNDSTTISAIQSLWAQSEGFPSEPEEEIPF
jgi:hypothetical protein